MKGENRMRKARFLLATAFILGLGAMAPRAEAAKCFQIYLQELEACSNLGTGFWGWLERKACGLDASIELAGCIRKTVIGV
jgi:hypothetical protein